MSNSQIAISQRERFAILVKVDCIRPHLISGWINVAQWIVVHVPIAIEVLRVAGFRYERIGRQKSPGDCIHDSPIHVDEPHVPEHGLAREALTGDSRNGC
jgi:hypothetical protein